MMMTKGRRARVEKARTREEGDGPKGEGEESKPGL
jgi:hypothetical protein